MPSRFERGHQRVRPVAAVAADDPRPPGCGQIVEDLEQPRQAVTAAVLVAGPDFGADHQAQAGHPVAVMRVRRTPGLRRVVRHHRALLFSVEGLDRRVDVENPGRLEQRTDAVAQMSVQPGDACGFRRRRQRTPQRVFADDLAHPEQPRIDAVAPNRVTCA